MSFLDALRRKPQTTAAPDFGGFWTDEPHAQQLALDLQAGSGVTPEEAQRLAHWIEHGYVVIEGALPAAEVDALQAAIDGAIDRSERPMTYWDADGKHQVTARRDKLKAAECKVIDVHAHLKQVQQSIFAPKMARFMELVMRSKAIAFQTLYFDYGSEQPVHQDTAFVYVEPPLEFMASWIALEDIQEGSGELVYYPGSQKLPHELFGNPPSKALLPGDPASGTYSAQLAQRCEAMGLHLQHFRPRRGDVLMWAADLVHGGSPRLRDQSRRSLVTHYCPANRKPPYAQAHDKPQLLDSGHFVLSQT